MSIDEVCKLYDIPIAVLKEYENWGLKNVIKKSDGRWQYDEADIERLKIILTLSNGGFDNWEIEIYLRLLLSAENTAFQRMAMLDAKRKSCLDEIHFRERQLETLDYLRYEIQKSFTYEK